MKLSSLFDGDTHELEPGVDFESDVVQALDGFEVVSEDEEIEHWESPTLRPVFSDRSGSTTANTIPGFDAQQGWGSLALAMSGLCRCLGVDKEQYQHNHYSPDGKVFLGTTYTFRLKASEEDYWAGGRL
jgi:hypothetical protein